ncbi:MAG: hypothetical protein JWP50_2894 [Phenylobacterium sp.]|nr:hypothetical protein [Phenylobacterium sp.]
MSRHLAPAAAMIAAAALAGCATRTPLATPLGPAPKAIVAPPPVAAPARRTVRMIAPKPVKCVPDDLGAPPAYPDGDAALRDAGGAADRYQLLAAGRILREQRLQRLEDVVKRCRNAGR